MNYFLWKLDNLEADDYLSSYKLDGVRMVINDGIISSNSGKEVPNKYLYEYFAPIIKLSQKHPSIYFDGEFYSHKITFNEIKSYWQTHDLKFPAISMSEFVPELQFRIFDAYFSEEPELTFLMRRQNLDYLFNEGNLLLSNITLVSHINSHTALAQLDEQTDFNGNMEGYMKFAISQGYEGVMLKHKYSTYKLGRATNKEATHYKVKEFEPYDAVILNVTQATIVDPAAPKTFNEQGYSVTSKKKDDRIPIEMAAGFLCKYKEETLIVSLTTMTEEERISVWKNRESLRGKPFTYMAMSVGSKDVPRSAKFLRYREE